MSIKNNTTSLQNILEAVNNLPEAGIDLPQLSNEGTASHLLSGKELIDQEGNIVTGSMPNNGAINMKFDGINQTGVIIAGGYTSGGTVSLDNTISNEVSTQEGLIQQIKNTANSLPDAGGTLQDKTITPIPAVQIVTADSGYDGLNKVTVNAIPSTYIQPLATKEATTYIPTTSDQRIPSGTYCSGMQTIKGDANLIPANIVSGTSIFGVAGTATTGGSSGDTTGMTISVINNLQHPIIVNGRQCDVEQTINDVPYDGGFVVFTIMTMDEDLSIVSQYCTSYGFDDYGVQDIAPYFYVYGDFAFDYGNGPESCMPTCSILPKYGLEAYNISGFLINPPWDYVNDAPLNGATIEFQF